MTGKARARFSQHVHVSRETIEKLTLYADLLRRWNPKINLVSKSTLDDIWDRHFLDSAQLFDMAPAAGSWADLGAGGGFPGAVVAILASELRPDLSVTLLEADQRKGVFLRTVLRETGSYGVVIARRIEQAKPLGADIVSARALAPLNKLLSFAHRHMAPSGTALFLKGANSRQEVDEALEHWRFDCETYPSKTDKEAVVLKIGEIERV